MNKYTFKVTKSDDKQTTIAVYAHDSRAAFDQVDRVIGDVQSFEIISVEKK